MHKLLIQWVVLIAAVVGLVVVANKFICSWCCQLGTLQDAIFRLNRDKQDRKGLFRQFKVPFAVSNGVRVAFFAAMGAILKRDRVIPDCFSCGTCIETCPARAISFRAGRRSRPPAGKFGPDVVEVGPSRIRQRGA